jgi:protein-disulfide isomerase
VLGRLVDAYPDAVQVTYRHFPLISIHANAQKAAESAEAARAQDAFWPYHDLLFERQNDWASLPEAEARDLFIGLAEELGLDTVQFASDLDGNVYADYVSTSYQEAINLNLSGTPSIILNGRLLPSDGIPFDYTVWENFVKEQIQLQEPSQ